MITRKTITLLIAYLFAHIGIHAQNKDSLDQAFLEEVNKNQQLDPSIKLVSALFKSTRIANGHTVEMVAPGTLDFRINHRFGTVDGGLYNFLGLDNAVTRIGFDYGVNRYLMVGLGRSTLNKEYDGFVKAKLLNQTIDGTPLAIAYVSAIYAVSEKNNVDQLAFLNRLTYLQQLLFARKFNENLSIQLAPLYMHFNMTNKAAENNDLIAVGIGGRYKITKRTAITGEYHFVPDIYKREDNFLPLTLGFDIDTGGHVFQLFFSNASGISERSLFTNTLSRWDKGQIHFGFNISRVFDLR